VAEKLSMAQIRELSDAEIRAKIAEVSRERSGLRFKAGTEVLGNPMDLRTTRRMVARLRTVLAQRNPKKRAGER
jgi:large subunit ribosomal protein L29